MELTLFTEIKEKTLHDANMTSKGIDCLLTSLFHTYVGTRRQCPTLSRLGCGTPSLDRKKRRERISEQKQMSVNHSFLGTEQGVNQMFFILIQ